MHFLECYTISKIIKLLLIFEEHYGIRSVQYGIKNFHHLFTGSREKIPLYNCLLRVIVCIVF